MVNLLFFTLLIIMFIKTFKIDICKISGDGYYLVYEIVLWNTFEQKYYTENKQIKIYNLKNDGTKYDSWY